jgi:hypothetical protein
MWSCPTGCHIANDRANLTTPLRMQPTRPAPMSGGLAVKTKKCGVGCGPETERSEGDYTARVFCSPRS